jgi:hypothetical protein
MAYIKLRKIAILDLLLKNDLVESNELILQFVQLIENELNIVINKPISAKLRRDIITRIKVIKEAWTKISTEAYRELYREDIIRHKRIFKLCIPSQDISSDSLALKYEAVQEKFAESKSENSRLEVNIKDLNRELRELRSKFLMLPETSSYLATNNHAAIETIDQVASDMQQGRQLMKAKSTTIRKMCETESQQQQLHQQQNRASQSGMNTADLILDTRRRYEQEKAREVAKYEREKNEAELFKHYPNLHKLTRVSQRKNYYLTSPRQKARLKEQIKGSILESTVFLRNMGLCIANIELNPVELEDPDVQKLKINYPHTKSENENDVERLLFYKDKHAISDRAYNDLKTKCLLKIPSLFKIKRFRDAVDGTFEVHNNEMGVFMSVEQKLRFRLEQFFKRKYKGDINEADVKFKDPIIHVKLGADGTNIGRNLKLLNFTFTLINEGQKSKGASGNYTLGIFEIESENYASVTECFKEIIEEIANLNTIIVQETELKIVYYYAGDWKMLANSLGIQGANSRYPCVWCKCAKENFYDTTQTWSISDTKRGARTHQEQAAILAHPKPKEIITFGYIRVPIFKDIIPLSRYMIDMLHLFLRISDTLFNLLVKDCSLADSFDMGAISKFDVSLYKHMNSLQHFLNEKCNVKFSFYWVQETKKLTWRDLVGPEKVRLFENLCLSQIIPDHEKFAQLDRIWRVFYEILQDVKEVKVTPEELKKRTSEWLELFLTVYAKSTVTPYMHAFVFHLHEFVRLYRDINAFNCQGLEKLNDISTGQYFKSTNKGATALHQMLKKRNRMEYLSQFLADQDE